MRVNSNNNNNNKVPKEKGAKRVNTEIRDDIRVLKYIACVAVVYMISQTAIQITVAVFLNSDSHTVEIIGNKTMAYMQRFDESGTLDNLRQLNQDYETVHRPRLLDVSFELKNATQYVSHLFNSVNQTQVVDSLHSLIDTFQDVVNELQYILNKKQINLNIPL
jgi:hypothetical protein